MAKILVIIDPLAERHTALERIREISPGPGMEFHVVLFREVVRLQASEAGSHTLGLAAKREWLCDLVAPFEDQGYLIDIDVLPFTDLHAAIVETVVEVSADLVFKPFRQHGRLRRTFNSSTDSQLIRTCPVPILLVSNNAEVEGLPIVAALDLYDRDPLHMSLNRKVIEQSRILAAVLRSEIHYVYAYIPPTPRFAGMESAALREDSYGDLEAYTRELKDYYGVSTNVHFLVGTPGQVIAEYAAEIKASVAVLGSMARSGVSRLLLGNTAEVIHESTKTDLLVVKCY